MARTLTPDDINLLKEIFATKEDLQAFATKDDIKEVIGLINEVIEMVDNRFNRVEHRVLRIEKHLSRKRVFPRLKPINS